MELVNSKPNSSEFYCHVHRKELEHANPDIKLAGFVLNSAIIEECATVEAVILYAKWALKYDIPKFHVIHQRGLKLFKDAELDQFIVEWTKLVQNVAREAMEHDCDETDKKVQAKSVREEVPSREEKRCLVDEDEAKEKEPKKSTKRKSMSRKRNPAKLSKLR
ncbi:unnamed protein product [Strongylus vulgaris]|uniref:Uncharacterized protein n=1 Tax=Strongylus vulgaris TaxID=40348 RepID=A0A3P7IJI2_STRVU|nr:unnamed protein product [Strongylus vulgaris]